MYFPSGNWNSIGNELCSITCCPFFYTYENEFLDNMIRSGHRRFARSVNLCYKYTDDLIVFNNKKFLDYLKEIYLYHLVNYLDLTFIIDSGGKLSIRLYDKRDDFEFHIVNFPFLSSSMPSGPSYGVCISQLLRYARCCSHSCYWLDQYLTLALNTWISLKFSTLYWICLLFIFLILMGVELPLCIVDTLSQNVITYFLESS